VDTTEGLLARLKQRYEAGGAAGRLLDLEKNLADYSPAIVVPDMDEVRKAIPAVEVPPEIPAVVRIVEHLVHKPLDPWDDAVTQIARSE
jgi:hypothetical protein